MATIAPPLTEKSPQPPGGNRDGFDRGDSGDPGRGQPRRLTERRYYTGMMLALAAIFMIFAAFTSALVVRSGLSDDWLATAMVANLGDSLLPAAPGTNGDIAELLQRESQAWEEGSTAGILGLFDEHFTVTSFDQSKYDRVARIGGTSGDSQTVMTLDINTELYPCSVGDNLHVVLANSLSLDGSKDDGKGWRDVSRNGPGGETTLADMFDYVCHGKIYKFEDGDDGNTM